MAVFNDDLCDQPDHAERGIRASRALRASEALAARNPGSRFAPASPPGRSRSGHVGTADQRSFAAIGDIDRTSPRASRPRHGRARRSPRGPPPRPALRAGGARAASGRLTDPLAGRRQSMCSSQGQGTLSERDTLVGHRAGSRAAPRPRWARSRPALGRTSASRCSSSSPGRSSCPRSRSPPRSSRSSSAAWSET